MRVEVPVRSETATAPGAALASWLEVAGDYLGLLKPRIILLLIVT
jgi:hypothetical protein